MFWPRSLSTIYPRQKKKKKKNVILGLTIQCPKLSLLPDKNQRDASTSPYRSGVIPLLFLFMYLFFFFFFFFFLLSNSIRKKKKKKKKKESHTLLFFLSLFFFFFFFFFFVFFLFFFFSLFNNVIHKGVTFRGALLT